MTSDHQSVIESLVHTVRNAVHRTAVASDDDADFTSVVTATRAALRHRRRGASSVPGHRGRKRKLQWHVCCFLLRRANADFMPSREESAYLSQNGLGMSSTRLAVTRGASLQQLEDIIVNQYPQVSLAMTGFTFARAGKGRRLVHFVGSTVDELEAFIAKGKMIIVPKRDLVMPSLQEQAEWIDAGTPTVSFHQRGASSSTTTVRASATQTRSSDTLTNITSGGTHLSAPLFVNHSQIAADLRHAHDSLMEIEASSASLFPHTTTVVSSTGGMLLATPSPQTTTANDGNMDHLRPVVVEPRFDISVSETVAPLTGRSSAATSFVNHTQLADVNMVDLLPSVQHSALSISTTRSYAAATAAVADTLSTVTPTTATTLMSSTVELLFWKDLRDIEQCFKAIKLRPGIITTIRKFAVADSNLQGHSGSSDSLGRLADSAGRTEAGFHETFSAEMVYELHEAFASVSNTLIDDNIQIIRIHRDRALDEVLQLYHDDAQLPSRRVKVEFIGELGDDVGGVTKDLYTLLWVQILQQYFCGESAVVPHLPLYKHVELRRNFCAIGRILAHTVALLKVVPARLSRSFLLCLSLGPSQVTEDLLLGDFRMFVTDSDRSLIDKAIADMSSLSSSQHDRLLSLFGTFSMFCNPHPGNIRQLILTIARQQLIDLPAPFVDDMKLGLPSLHVDLFWSQLTLPAIEYIFMQQLPTPARVSSILTPQDDELRQDQLNALYYLQQFVAALDPEELASFLHFVTGSTVMPNTIWVSFNSLCGELRRPIAHTCSNTVELSYTYSSVQELKRDFMAILRNPQCFEMDMV